MRRRVPLELRAVIGKTEITYSYQTDSFRQAVRRHPGDMAKVEAVFEAARQKLAGAGDHGSAQAETRLAMPTEDDVRAVVNLWLHRELQKMSGRKDVQDPVEFKDILNTDEFHLSGPDGLQAAARGLPDILRGFGFDTPPPAGQGFALRLLQAAMVEAVQRQRDHIAKQPVERVHSQLFSGVFSTDFPPAPPAPPGVTVADLCARYLSTPERAGLSPKTKLKYKGMFRVLSDLLGAGTDAAKITRDDCRRVQSVLLEMPANAQQRYPGMKAHETAQAAKRDGVAPMHVKSVGNHLDLLAALFRWGAIERVIRLPDGNPAERLAKATTKTVTAAAKEERRPFTPEELKAIFTQPIFTGCKDDKGGYATPGTSHPRRGRFWVPLLGLYAGLRLNEACQLHAADIEVADGVPMIHVQAKAPDQRLKSEAADRHIPIHPELVRIGFLKHVASQKKAGVVRLFPDLHLGKLENYSDPFSKWFARFLEKAGVTSTGTVFHSFRHGFKDRLLEAEVPREVRDGLCGWATPGQGGKYGNGLSAASLAGHVSRIDYPDLDLTLLHLASGTPS
jgi:integrase